MPGRQSRQKRRRATIDDDVSLEFSGPGVEDRQCTHCSRRGPQEWFYSRRRINRLTAQCFACRGLPEPLGLPQEAELADASPTGIRGPNEYYRGTQERPSQRQRRQALDSAGRSERYHRRQRERSCPRDEVPLPILPRPDWFLCPTCTIRRPFNLCRVLNSEVCTYCTSNQALTPSGELKWCSEGNHTLLRIDFFTDSVENDVCRACSVCIPEYP